MDYLRSAIIAEAFAFPSMKPEVFWPNFLGLTVLVIGLLVILRDWPRREPGMESFIMLGPLFFAVPMAVFSGDHFAFPAQIAQIVPAWMPWHMFWVYFVGTALVAGGLALALRKYSKLAALLLGVMLFCFVLMIHIPNLIAAPGDRFALAVMLRDLSFSCGALAFAIGEPRGRSEFRSQIMLTVLRCTIAVAAVIFGIEHFLHPNFVPVIPLKRELPAWMPGHLALSYTTGAVLIAAGIALIINRRARQVATWLGAFVFAVVLLVYVPILLTGPSDNERLNYVADTLVYSGSALLLAGAMPRRQGRESSSGNRATTIAA